MTLEALWVAACPYEASRFFDWIAGTVAAQMQRGAGLQIMFGIGGEHDLSERALSHLAGWPASQPVRLGNDALEQPQLDIYGGIISSVRLLRDQIVVLCEPAPGF